MDNPVFRCIIVDLYFEYNDNGQPLYLIRTDVALMQHSKTIDAQRENLGERGCVPQYFLGDKIAV
jgi:hypothetical protein